MPIVLTIKSVNTPSVSFKDQLAALSVLIPQVIASQYKCWLTPHLALWGLNYFQLLMGLFPPAIINKELTRGEIPYAKL
jgi:hypothetical protein